MAGRKSDFTLTKLDDLFTTQAQREEEKLSKIRDIPLGLIDDFPDHPFKVRDLLYSLFVIGVEIIVLCSA